MDTNRLEAFSDGVFAIAITLLVLEIKVRLMFIAFVPFPTAVLAQAFLAHSGRELGAAFYAGTLTVIGILVTAMWWYASSHRELLNDAISPEQASAIGKRFLVGPICYGLATILAFVNPWLSMAIFMALNVYFLWPHRHQVISS